MFKLRQQSFESIEQRLLLALDDAVDMATLANDFQEFWVVFQDQVAQGAFSNEELCLFDQQAARIKNIARLFAALRRSSDDSIKAAEEEAKDILANSEHLSHSKPGKTSNEMTPASTMQDTLNSQVLRRWFLDHVSDPFPSRRTKEDLVLTTNALVKSTPPSTNKKNGSSLSNQPIDYSQCTLWFINSRRRSHWTDFFRQFAHSDKERMRVIVECLRREEDAEAPCQDDELEKLLYCSNAIEDGCCQDSMEYRMAECREMYTHMMDWLRQITKEQIGDWMDDVIREAKAELKQEKRARMNERKQVAELTDKMEEGREQKKQKVSTEKEEVTRQRRSDRSQKRKMAERKERREHRQVPTLTWVQTPDRNIQARAPTDTSSSSNWTSCDSSLRVPSTSGSSNYQASPLSTASSSSFSSYDAFPYIQRSPTHNTRNQKMLAIGQKELQPTPVMTPAPISAASLYTSSFVSPNAHSGFSSPSIVVHPTPVVGHLEDELSGGSRSGMMSRSNSYFGNIKMEHLSPTIPYSEFEPQAVTVKLTKTWPQANLWAKSSPV